MTREQADILVLQGLARWLDPGTLEVAPGPPLMRYADPMHPGNEVVSEAGPSIVRFSKGLAISVEQMGMAIWCGMGLPRR